MRNFFPAGPQEDDRLDGPARSTVRHADVILVFNHGRIVESGTHDQLIAKAGTCKLLVETQLL